MEREIPDKEENLPESKRSRRSQSKFNKEVPRYECFCSKQYLSYPALYLHLKNKHQQHFQNSKNGKKVETTKLVESFDSAEGFKVYKISIDTNTEKDKHEVGGAINKAFEGQGFGQNSMYFPTSNFMAYGTLPYQTFPYEFVGNKEESTPMPKDAVIETAFHMFIEALGHRSTKEKTEIELLLAMLLQCINENYLVSKQHGEELQCARYTAQRNSKYLTVFTSFFERYWLPQAQNQDRNEYYSFFAKHSAIIRSGRYRKVLQQLIEFVDGEKHEEFSEHEALKSQPLYSEAGNESSSEVEPNSSPRAADHQATSK